MGDFEAVRTKEIAVQHGEPVTLPCSVPLGYPPPVVTWIMEKNSQIQYLKETNRRATDINGFLYIAAVIEEDHDTLYTCVANNEVLRHQKNGPSYKIKVYGQQTNYALRSLYRTPRTEVAIAGDTLQLKCIYGGFPTPQYTWFKDDKENIELPNVAIKNTGTMLEISPVNEEAAGQYRCQGSNEQTRTTMNSQYTVHVQVRPTFVEKPEDITVPVNGSVTFRCTAKGTPTPQIRWTVNGEDPAGYIDGVRKTLSGSVMRLYNLTVKDTAVIQCNASNAFGYDLVNAYVNVMREPPYFIKPPQSELRVVDGHEVTLNCQTFSAPKAVISWSKDGRPINGGRYRSLPNGDLRIAAAANTDSGIYECTATNPFGSRKASGRLLVRRRTRIVLAPIDTQVYENQVVKFVCTAETDPVEAENLKITWYKDNNLIMPDVTPRIQPVWFDYSLVLSGAQPRDTGQYRCNASNGLDFAVASASLLVQGAPEQAIRVQVNCVEFINEELALVSWYPGSDNYSPIMEYIVEYSTQYERETWYPAEIFNYTGLVQSTSTKVLLRPAILYWFRVRTRNRVGTSLPSSPTTTECGIPPRVPEVNPRELYVYGSMRNNMIIRWTTLPYIEHYGSNLGYELTIACLNCDIIPKSAINHTVIGDWRTDRITLTSFRVGRTIYELETFKQFRVTIQSRNEKGMSTAPPTVAFGYSGEAVPTISPPTPTVINVTGQGAVLQWQALTEAQAFQVNGYFRGYRIEWCDASATSTQCAAGTRFQDVLVRIPTTPVLYNRRRRSVSIREEEQASANDTNDWHGVHSTAEESVLDRYLSNTSKPTSRTYAPFWSRYSISPICGTNPVRVISCPGAGRFPRAAQSPSILGDAYDSVVSRMPRQTTSPRVPQAVTGTQKSAPFVYGQTITHTLTGVPGASTARVWLRVLNTRFAGPMGGTVEITTLEDTPGPVANLRSTGVGVTFAEITWTPPSEPNGIVLGYEFEAMELLKLVLVNWLVRVQRKFACCGATSHLNWLSLDIHTTPAVNELNQTEYDPWIQLDVVTCESALLTPSSEVTIYHLRYDAPVYRRDCNTAAYDYQYTELGGLIGLFAAVDVCLHLLQVCTQLYSYHKTAPRYPCVKWANKLPPLQSKLTPPKFGSRRESTGSIIHRTGSITHADGSRTHTDGSVTFPDGKTLPKPEKLVHRSGSITLRSGSRLHRTGSRTHLDGSRTHRTGSITYEDGSRRHRDQMITPGPGDSREGCMVGANAQMFFGSTGYINTERLIQACQGIHLFAQPSLVQQMELDDKAEWLERNLKIGWIVHGGGKQHCTIVPLISLKSARVDGPIQTSELRRFLRLQLPILEAIIYTDGNAILENEANAYYRSFGVCFIRSILFLLFGYVAACLIFPLFLPTNLDSPVLYSAPGWVYDSMQRHSNDQQVAEDAQAIHQEVTKQAGLLLYTCIMGGMLISRRTRCLVVLLIPIFSLCCGHIYLCNQMLQATLLGPVSNAERNFVSTGATLDCLAEMTYNVSRDIDRATRVYPLDDAITEEAADVIRPEDPEFRNVTPGLVEMSTQLAENVTEKLLELYNMTSPVLLISENQLKLAAAVESEFTEENNETYLESAKRLIRMLSDPVSKKRGEALDRSNRAHLPMQQMGSLQKAITIGGEFEENVNRMSVMSCMLIRSLSVKRCREKATELCDALKGAIQNLDHEPVWFREACLNGKPTDAACPTRRFLLEAEKDCHAVPSTLGMEYGVGAFAVEAVNVLETISKEFQISIDSSDEEEDFEPGKVEQWMNPSSTDTDTKRNELADRMYMLFYILIIVSALARLFIVGVFFQAHRYISAYLLDVKFDNVYAGKMFEMIDSKRLDDGRDTLLPLKSMEREHVYWRTRFYTAKEIKRVMILLLRIFVFGFILLLAFAANNHLIEMVAFLVDLTFGYYGMRRRVGETSYTGSYAIVKGADGIFQKLLTRFFHNLDNLKSIDLDYDASYCSPTIHETSELLESDFYTSWYGLFALALFSPLLLRLRHVVASFFYPSRVRHRTVHLYNSLLTQRRRHMTTTRNLIVHWVREGRLQEEARRMSQPSFVASVSQNLAKVLGMDKKICLICHDAINPGPNISVCTLDKAALCRQCVEVVLRKDVCVVCLDRNPKRLFKERRKIQRLENQLNLRVDK
ncbi:unnamed protein product [Dicrocoelium dendriticum]|nr:unnamed protein product [Dicrocoelium dendriticum]